jgi:S-adenosylmethionine:tRNA ribosyltransferase-isomerase
MRVTDFDFELPEAQIAQVPRPRGESRLLVVRRDRGAWSEHAFSDLPALLSAGDLVVANDTKVFPARLLGRRDPSGGAVECLLLERVTGDDWCALVHPGQKLGVGARLVFADEVRAPGVTLRGLILARESYGKRLVRIAVEAAGSVDEAVDAIGHVPLPPYVRRAAAPEDAARYQTRFAVTRGSVAAPTAGLHFSDAMLPALRGAGIGWATVTLHVGYGTFKPVRGEDVEAHTVDAERFVISRDTADAIARARQAGRRVVAVGTTTTRALESAAAPGGLVRAQAGRTDLFVRPGHTFRAVDALVTNFHLPRSSLLMLVAAFAGRDLTLAAYRHAVAAGFRFYSYGDAMLIL